MLVDNEVCERVLGEALKRGGEFAEIFVEDRRATSARYDEGRVEELTSGRDRGAGIRVIVGESTGFAHTADLSEAGLLEAAKGAATAVGRGAAATKSVGRLVEQRASNRSSSTNKATLPETIDKGAKIALLQRADAAAREVSGAIQSVSVSYADSRRKIQIANSDGLSTGDDRVRTRFMVQCVASGDTGMQTGMEAPGRGMGFEFFNDFEVESIARTAAERSVSLLSAVPAPSGQMAVVLKRGAGGVLFHEACGHGLEADLVQRDASVFKDRIGTQVASELVTVIDDGTFAREWGTYDIDDEGQAAQRNVLIENGVLTDYMWDLVRARKSGRASSGNGRRETYRHLPMVRMTNTFLPAGDTDPDAIIRDTQYGIYCVQLGGGQVDTATGDFVFGVTEGYLIENGEITRPIRAAQLVGNGPQTMTLVDAVGNDFETWTGTCGKSGQGVPVSSGQPTLRVARMTVGGTAS